MKLIVIILVAIISNIFGYQISKVQHLTKFKLNAKSILYTSNSENNNRRKLENAKSVISNLSYIFSRKRRKLSELSKHYLSKFGKSYKFAIAQILICLSMAFAPMKPSFASTVTTTPSSIQKTSGKGNSPSTSNSHTIAHDSHSKSKSSSHSHEGDSSSSSSSSLTTTTSSPSISEEDRDAGIDENDHEALVEVKRSVRGLVQSLQGAKLDSLIMLLVTSAVIPIFKRLNASPIIGFLLTGTLLGPTGLNWVKDIHLVDMIGELGIVFFLFEMGLELSLDRLKTMRRDVFGLGTLQFLVTSALGTGASLLCGLPPAAAVTIGGSLSLSSSAFVLELLKDKKALGTRHGKASFGILLLQDLAVVPLLVVVELLSKGGAGLGKALTLAGIKALITLCTMGFIGRSLLNPIFYFVAKSYSQEAFLSIILSTVLLMSFVTKGLGLSDTLGAFLAGLLLSETKFKYQIESDIGQFRGLLLGIFFITVGFSIDLNVILKETPTIIAMLFSLILGKASVITALTMMFGMPFSSAQQCGLLNAQGGEFAFVAFGIAQRSGLISKPLAKKLLTTVALSMAFTPLLSDIGSHFATKIQETVDLKRITHSDDEVKKLEKDFVLVLGYGRVGKMVCEMLDRHVVKYVAIDKRPDKAIEARTKGLPVFFGDITRPEVLRNFVAKNAKACVLALGDMKATNAAIVSLRKLSPDLPIIVSARDSAHQQRLENMFDGVYAMSPVLPEDSVLLSIPFGGVVLQKIGLSKPEIDLVMEEFRRMYMEDGGNINDDTFDFLEAFRRRLPPSEPQPVITEENDRDPIATALAEDPTTTITTITTTNDSNINTMTTENIPAHIPDDTIISSTSSSSNSNNNDIIGDISDSISYIEPEVSPIEYTETNVDIVAPYMEYTESIVDTMSPIPITSITDDEIITN